MVPGGARGRNKPGVRIGGEGRAGRQMRDEEERDDKGIGGETERVEQGGSWGYRRGEKRGRGGRRKEEKPGHIQQVSCEFSSFPDRVCGLLAGLGLSPPGREES